MRRSRGINARKQLWAQLREFVNMELGGLIKWDDVTRLEPELASEIQVASAGGAFYRANPLGPYREIAAIELAGYQVRIMSPEEHGPLGRVELVDNIDGGKPHVIDSGPIDQVIWKRLGKIIRATKV